MAEDNNKSNEPPRDVVKLADQVLVRLFGPDGKLKEERRVNNLIVDVGCAHIADQMSDQGEGAMSHMAIGTGTTAAAAGDTTLETELDRNALDSTTQGAGASDHQVTYTASWAAGDGTGAITEAGIFNDPAAGVMLARVVFAVVNKGAGDTLQIDWVIGFADDGV